MYVCTFTHLISQRLFSNGGNYCREEVEFFDKKLVSILYTPHVVDAPIRGFFDCPIS